MVYFPRTAYATVTLATLFYSAVVVMMAIHAVVYHNYNWDMLFYLGAAMSIQHSDLALVHHMVFSTVQQHIPESQFHQLLSTKYQMAVYRDYHLFEKIMPFYTVKPLYIASIYAVHSLGVGWVDAPTVISTVAFVLTAAVCLIWILTHTHGRGKSLWVLAAACVMSSGPVLRTITLSTPDALSMALMALLVVCFMRRKLILSGVFSLLAILTRPDDIIFTTALLLVCAVFAPKKQKRISVFFILLGWVAYLTVSKLAHAYSWGTLFEHAFYSEAFDPSTYTLFVTPALYWQTLSQQFWAFVSNTSVILYLSGALLLIGMGIRRNISIGSLWESQHAMYIALLAVAAVSIVGHVLLFPNSDDRFFVSEYITILLCAIGLLQGPSPIAGWRSLRAS